MRNLILLLAGAFGGVAFVLACGTDRVSAGGDANAQPSGCSTWEVADVFLGAVTRSPSDLVLSDGTTTAVYEVPAGWEPYQFETNTVMVRRCRP